MQIFLHLIEKSNCTEPGLKRISWTLMPRCHFYEGEANWRHNPNSQAGEEAESIKDA